MRPISEFEEYRVMSGINPFMISNPAYGRNGVFRIRSQRGNKLLCIVSDDGGWQHVSVEVEGKNRTPYWDEMCDVKRIFWRDDEVVLQYHPAKSNYVNVHPYVLHLWKPLAMAIPVPPIEFV
jgi:hypothetical protein